MYFSQVLSFVVLMFENKFPNSGFIGGLLLFESKVGAIKLLVIKPVFENNDFPVEGKLFKLPNIPNLGSSFDLF